MTSEETRQRRARRGLESTRETRTGFAALVVSLVLVKLTGSQWFAVGGLVVAGGVLVPLAVSAARRRTAELDMLERRAPGMTVAERRRAANEIFDANGKGATKAAQRRVDAILALPEPGSEPEV